MPSRILFIFTSADKTLTGAQTGWYLPEAAHPYYVLSPHHHIDFAAPKGPNPPVDEYSVKTFTDDESVRFLQDKVVQEKLASAQVLSKVNANDYDVIFYPGGHGPVLDLATDPVNIKLATEFYRQGKLTTAVCHGPAALVGVKDKDNKSIFEGKACTGFTNTEEELAGKVADVPFLLETRLIELGGNFEKAPKPWEPRVVVVGNLITGQNPMSAKGVGEAILQAL